MDIYWYSGVITGLHKKRRMGKQAFYWLSGCILVHEDNPKMILFPQFHNKCFTGRHPDIHAKIEF